MLKELLQLIFERTEVAKPAILQATPTSQKCVIVPNGYTVKDLPGHIPDKPNHIKASVNTATPAGLLDYIALFDTKNLLLFANERERSVSAILDYHTAQAADRCTHIAKWILSLDEGFEKWRGSHGVFMTHEQFVKFLDSNSELIVTPSSGELIALVEQIEVISSGSKVSHVARRGDRSAFRVQSEDSAAGRNSEGELIEPVREFVLLTPVSINGQPRSVTVNVHWSISGGKLSVSMEIHSLDALLRQEFYSCIQPIKTFAASIGKPVIEGGV